MTTIDQQAKKIMDEFIKELTVDEKQLTVGQLRPKTQRKKSKPDSKNDFREGFFSLLPNGAQGDLVISERKKW